MKQNRIFGLGDAGRGHPEETAILIRWKKRSGNHVLVRMRAEVILYASRGVDVSNIAEMVERMEGIVQEWLADWRENRMRQVLAGHAGNQNAAKPSRVQKIELKTVLAQPPSRSGAYAQFWDITAVRDVVKIWFDALYHSDSAYQLLLRLCGMSLDLPALFDKRRDELTIVKRMTEVKTRVGSLLGQGWEVYTVDEVRVKHEAWTCRIWITKSQRTKLYVDRKKAAQSFFGALSLTSKAVKLYPVEDDQNTEQNISALDQLHRRNPQRQDRRRSGSRPPSRQDADLPVRAAGPAAGTIHPIPSTCRRTHPTTIPPSTLEHGQGPYRRHSTRDTRRNLQRIRFIHHRSYLRPPLTSQNRKRFV